MPETESFLPNDLTSKGITILDKNGSIVELPPTTQLSDLTIVKVDNNNKYSLPNDLASEGLRMFDKFGNEFLILNSLEDATADAIETATKNTGLLVNPPIETIGENGVALADRFAKDTEEYRDGDFELADLNTVLMEEVEKDKFRKGVKHGDVSLDKYNFDGNNVYATGDAGVEIDGFLFFPKEVKGEESYAHREYNRTKIMSGGEFVTRGQYVPKEFSFSTTLDIDPNQPYMYDKLFQIMENKSCRVVSPYMGDIFNAEVKIDKIHPEASPASLELDIKVKEIVDPKTTVVGDTPIKYPSTNEVDDNAIDVRDITKYDPKPNEKNYDDKIKADSKVYYPDGREVTDDTDPFSQKNWNQHIDDMNNNNN